MKKVASNVDKLKKEVDKSLQEIIPINLGKDPLFTLIELNPVTQEKYRNILWCSRALGFFASLSLFLAIVSTVFYRNKSHLQIMGLISLIHICTFICGEYNNKGKHRYILLVMIVLNSLWLGATFAFLFTEVFVLDAKQSPSKKEFKKEIHFHVILLLYTATAIGFTYLVHDFCDYLIKHPPENVEKATPAQPNTPRTASVTPAVRKV